MKNQSSIPLCRPEFSDQSIAELVDVVRSGWLTTGPRVARFEFDFAKYVGVDRALALGSCTASLHLALLSCQLSSDDEVIVPALTYCATAHAVVHAGSKPVICDVDPDTCIMSLDHLEALIGPKTRAIIVVHFAGYPAPMIEICAIARRAGLTVIEDCAHAIETSLSGQHAGTFGDFGCFSFYATKNVSTGEGGALIGKDQLKLADARLMSLHGVSKGAWNRSTTSGVHHYDVVAPGFKYNMMDVQAALGIYQLAEIESHWMRRQTIWLTYKTCFAELPVICPADAPAGDRHAHHLFSVRLSREAVGAGLTRDGVISALGQHGIGSGVHYHALSEFTYFKSAFKWTEADCPVSTEIGRNTFSLPLNPYLTDGDVDRICQTVVQIFGRI